MSEGIRWCFEDQDLDEAAKMMNEAQVRRLPVVNREKRLVGTLGLRDVVLDGEPQKAVEILRDVVLDGEPQKAFEILRGVLRRDRHHVRHSVRSGTPVGPAGAAARWGGKKSRIRAEAPGPF